MSYINDTSIDDINVKLSEVTSLNSTLTEPLINHSGTVCVGENTEMKIPRPEIWRVQNFTEEIKCACAKTSSSSGISVDKAIIAVQVVCNEPYQHKYYLSKEEQLFNVDIDQISIDIYCSEPIAKCVCSETHLQSPQNQQWLMKFINMSFHQLRLFETIKTFKLLKKNPMQVLNYLKRVLAKM